MQDKAERNEDAVAKMEANRKLVRDYSHIPATPRSPPPLHASNTSLLPSAGPLQKRSQQQR